MRYHALSNELADIRIIMLTLQGFVGIRRGERGSGMGYVPENRMASSFSTIALQGRKE